MRTLEVIVLHCPVHNTEATSEGGCIVPCPDLPGCITCGETFEEALANAEDSRCWFEVALSQRCDIQEPGTWDLLSVQ